MFIHTYMLLLASCYFLVGDFDLISYHFLSAIINNSVRNKFDAVFLSITEEGVDMSLDKESFTCISAISHLASDCY